MQYLKLQTVMIDNSASEPTTHAVHPQSHSVKLMNIRSLAFSISQESMRGEDLLSKGRKRKTTTQAIQISPNGQHEIEITHFREKSSPDYSCQYAKDRLTGKITCMVCGEEGHYTCDCSMKDQEEKVVCTLCNRIGHCHLWCCKQNVSKNRACRRCGEKGHYTKKKLSYDQKCSHNKDISCSSCDTNHLLGKCPMGDITCFICEGKDHVPAQCRLSPMLTAVTRYHRECFHATLKKAMAETRRRTLPPVKPSGEFSHDEEIPDTDKTSHATMTDKTLALISKTTCLNYHEEAPCADKCPRKKPSGELEVHDRKSPVRSQAPNSDKANHGAMRNKAVTLVSKLTCFNCHEEGHYANKCPRKKPPEELELHDATHINFHANRCPKKKVPGELELSDVTCFNCHDKGHKSYSCPKKKSAGELELYDFTCFKCHDKGHKSYSCPKKSPGDLELSDVTCFKCHVKGHKSYSCSKKQSDICFRCHDKGHYMNNCPKKKLRR